MFNEIIKLSKQIATSLLKGKPSKSLTDSKIFNKADKEYILKSLTDETLVKERQDLRKQIDKKSDLKKINDVLGFPDSNWNWKYLAAAVITGVLVTAYFFKNNDNNLPNIEVVDTVKHNNPNNIEIGTDKATLTLEDGSQVVLEKGASFQRQNIKSNGEEIVYDAKDLKSEVIKYNYLTIPRGGQFFIKLSDGTQVWLNSESELKYPVRFIEGEPRKVELVYGEAYFNVSPSSDHNGDKFLVYSTSQEVEVIGTEFNIKAYKDETNIYTTLVEGKVAINIDEKKQNLLPGQQLFLDKINSTLLIKAVDVYNETAWKEGVFSFDNKSLKEMMVVLSRWYDVEVIIENKSIENEEFVGILRKNQKIEEILTSIKNFGIIKNYEIYDKKVTIK